VAVSGFFFQQALLHSCQAIRIFAV